MYNIKDKGVCKLLARYWDCPQQELVSDLENGDASETARKVITSFLIIICLPILFLPASLLSFTHTVVQFFKKYGKPAAKSTLTLGQVDKWLDELTTVTKEDNQLAVWGEVIPICTLEDLRMLWRIVDHDLRILSYLYSFHYVKVNLKAMRY